MNRANTTIRGVSFLVLSLLIFSLQDIAIKIFHDAAHPSRLILPIIER